jgi:hypothetical protein
LKDLVDRASSSPDAVFQQLCNLSVGPIITDTAKRIGIHESQISDLYPDLYLLSVDGP